MKAIISLYALSVITIFAWILLFTEMKTAKNKSLRMKALTTYFPVATLLSIITLLSWLL